MSISGRRALIIGSVGAIIAGVASLLWFLDGLRYLNFYLTWYFLWGHFEGCLTGSVLGVGIILAAVSYRNYRIRTGTASFALGIVAGASFVISLMVSYFGHTYIPYITRGRVHPWNILFAILALMTLVLFGVMQIVWGIAHIKSRKHTASRLAIVTRTMLIASGALTVSISYAYAGPLLFFVSQILTIIIFLTPKMPQQTT